jgi:chlorobactene glucosyltransferase
MIALALAVTCALIAMTLISVLNAFTLPRLDKTRNLTSNDDQLVSVMIPARNEAGSIGSTVRSLLAQDYPRFELLVLDDGSSDATRDVACAAAGGDARLQVITGKTLPAGWLGKNWACQQLAERATGAWLVFTDADVHWETNAVSKVVAEMVRTQADCLAVWPTQVSVSWSERLVVPLMAMTVIAYLPTLLVHHTPWASLSAANGQCLVFRREAYCSIGGHNAVRDRVLDDVMFARTIKSYGLRLRMVDASGLITCRMYGGWRQVRDGFAKNILAGHADSVFFLAMSAIFHWLVFVGPWLWLAFGWMRADPGWPLWPLTLVMLGTGVRALTAAVSRQRPADAILMPFSTVLMTVIAAQSVWWRWHYGGPVWKGRVTVASPNEETDQP